MDLKTDLERGKMKRDEGFQLLSERDETLVDSNFISQIKVDGRRVRIKKQGDVVTFIGRDNIVQERYPEVIEAIKKIQGNFELDTEFCVFITTYRDTKTGRLLKKQELKDYRVISEAEAKDLNII